MLLIINFQTAVIEISEILTSLTIHVSMLAMSACWQCSTQVWKWTRIEVEFLFFRIRLDWNPHDSDSVLCNFYFMICFIFVSLTQINRRVLNSSELSGQSGWLEHVAPVYHTHVGLVIKQAHFIHITYIHTYIKVT